MIYHIVNEAAESSVIPASVSAYVGVRGLPDIGLAFFTRAGTDRGFTHDWRFSANSPSKFMHALNAQSLTWTNRILQVHHPSSEQADAPPGGPKLHSEIDRIQVSMSRP